MAEGRDLEYLVLNLLDRADGPVGSGAVCGWLRQSGTAIGESSVGRFFRALDLQNLTERAGYQGHVLTEQGKVRLAELRHERAVAASSTELMRTLRINGIDEIIGVLVARRGLEREVALLATVRATETDLRDIELLVERYQQASTIESADQADLDFHYRMAVVAGNKVLEAATRLIHAEAQATTIPEAVHRKEKKVLVRQHWEILAALRAHDSQRAEAATVGHLDYLIEAVKRFGA